MKRIRIFSVALMFVLGACNSATAAPVTPTQSLPTATAIPLTPKPLSLTITVEELVGFWKDVDGYIEFKPDGTWAFATTLDALKAGTLYVEGTFSVEGDEITILDDICGNRIGVYRLETKTENKLTFTQVKEECVGQRRLPFLERILSDTPAPTSGPTDMPVSPFLSFPSARCCNGTPIESGEYELPSWAGIPLTMELGEGWQVVNEGSARLFMLGKGESIFNDPTQVLVFIAIPDGNPRTILESIKSERVLIAQSDISETMIAGFPGLQVDLTAKPNPEYKGSKQAEIPAGVQFLPTLNRYFTTGFLWTTWSAEARLRFIAVKVGEHVLLLEIDSPLAEFEAFASEANQLLQTLKLRR